MFSRGEEIMIKHLSVQELCGIASRGGGLEVDGSQFSTLDLGTIGARLGQGATLKIHNCAGFSALDMGSIASHKPGQIIFC
jgi:hypothetical protein